MESLFSAYVLLIGIILFMVLIAWLGLKLTVKTKYPLSPYSQMPLRHANTLRYTTFFIVKKYLKQMEDLDNREFDLNRAALCRETGRIFPNVVNWRGKIYVDWTFLQKRMAGTWVSWGSLPDDRQLDLLDKHGTLEGFQTESSSENPLPQEYEAEYNLIKPGPLYVNLENDVVMGWKVIPETEVEVLVVKRPIIHI
ncbi:MAG: hypothetical protein K940chlam3_00200 [Chlamydiae bacterium]|nr:hypothetical protein [Chlamydiota bacterium]